jgi:hypothetical protein
LCSGGEDFAADAGERRGSTAPTDTTADDNTAMSSL